MAKPKWWLVAGGLVAGATIFAAVACDSSNDSPNGASTSTSASASTSASTGSSGGGAGTGGSAPALTASDYCESIMEPFCDFYIRCGRMAVDTVEQCHAKFLPSCNNKYEGRYVDLEGQNLLSLSSAGLAACAEHLKTVSCAQQVFELTGPCAGIFEGKQPAGGKCGLDVENFICAPGTTCTLGLDFCGTCETIAPLGADCTGELTSCGPEAQCKDGTCVARVKIGEACQAGDTCSIGASCIGGTCQGQTYAALNGACGQGVRCPYLTACIGGTCQLTANLQEACSSDEGCNTDHCAATGECIWPQPNGSTCDRNAACSSGICTGGICQKLPSACVAP